MSDYVRIQVYLTAEQERIVRELAAKNERNMSAEVRFLVRKALEGRE